MKVDDHAAGQILATSQWKIFQNQRLREEEDKVDMPNFLEGEERERSEAVMGYFCETRREAMPGPFVCKYRRFHRLASDRS